MRLIVAFCACAVMAAAAETPESVVVALYRDHFAQGQEFEATFKRNRERFAPELLALLEKSFRDQAANPDEIAGLDFNPLTNAQEEADGYEVTGTTREGADAVVAVSVRFGAERQKIRVRLSPSGATWRVANVLYEEGDLAAILKAPQ